MPHALFHVLLTLATVIVLGRLLGRVLALVGQPRVIGEVLVGILLGPSLLGWLAPEVAAWLVPTTEVDPNRQVVGAIKILGQLGVVLYMFLVGIEFDAASFRGSYQRLLTIAIAGMIVSFLAGLGLGSKLGEGYAGVGANETGFSIFVGLSLAVTAFPVLARILSDRGMTASILGRTALGAAALGDALMWCVLAGVIGYVRSRPEQVVVTVVGSVAFVAVMWLVVRPGLHRLIAVTGEPSWIAGIAFALLSAAATEWIGIHALFGAFLAGTMIPHDGRLAKTLETNLEAIVSAVLLPAFFAATGLQLRIGAIDGWNLIVTVGIIIAATVGKVGGTYLAARAFGMANRESAALGALMNTRGLMELIVLDLGLDLKIITPRLYAMLVIMALVTTAMTGPLLWLLRVPQDCEAAAPGA